MATANTNKTTHDEHPHSRFVDKDDPSHTLYNVANSLSLIKQFDVAELEGVEAMGAQAIIEECVSAIYFEALRLDEKKAAKDDEDITAGSEFVPIRKDHLKQAEVLAEVIATEANVTSRWLQESCPDGYLAAGMVSKIGWMADLITGKLDGTDAPACVGGIEQWMLPPSYQWATKEPDEAQP